MAKQKYNFIWLFFFVNLLGDIDATLLKGALIIKMPDKKLLPSIKVRLFSGQPWMSLTLYKFLLSWI